MPDRAFERGPSERRSPRHRTGRILGLTGPVAGGKTFLLRLFGEAGATTIEADAVYAELVRPGAPLLKAIGDAFPGAVRSEGSLDRGELGAVVFRDPNALKRLSDIAHPALGRAVAENAAEYVSAGTRHLVIEAAVLFSMRADALCDEVWFVSAPTEERVRRLMAARGWTEDRARAVVDAQGAMREIRAACAREVDGESGPETLRGLVREWMEAE